MNTFLNRLNIIVMYAIMVLIALTLCANIPLLWHSPEPYVGIHNVTTLAYGRPSYPSPYSHIYMHTNPHVPALLLKFDLDLDMRSCVTWGVKQLMVWLVVEYATTSPARSTTTTFPVNQVVVWDSIVHYDQMEDEANLLIENLEALYPISELGGKIDFSQPMKFIVQWEITPILGIFKVHQGKYTLKTVDIKPPAGSAPVKIKL